MAFITLQGKLLDPDGSVSIGDELRFTHKSTTGSTLKSAVTLMKITTLGNYYIDLQYGLVLVEYKDVKNSQFENLGVVTVNQDSTATTLPELLNAIVPPTDEQLLEFQAILADCVIAQDAAAASAAAALVSENAAAASAATLDLINDLSQAYIFDTVALFKASLIEFPDGKIIHLNDRDADFAKITGTGTANTSNILASTSVNQSIVLITAPRTEATKYGVSNATVDSSSQVLVFLSDDTVDSKYFSGGDYLFSGNMSITHTPLTISGDNNSTVVNITNSENSNGFDLADGVGGNDITIKDLNFTSAPLAGKFTQAITLNNCVNVDIENVNLTGFTQFPISLRYTLSQSFGNVNIKNVHSKDASFAGAGVSNALEIFAGGANGHINNLVVEDSSFSISTGKGGNIAKFGVSISALVNRCRFNSLNRTGESSSSGVEVGSASNTTVDSIEFRDCNFNDSGQTTGLYGFASKADSTLLTRCDFVASNNSIFFPVSVSEFKVVDGFISKILFGAVTIDKFHMQGGEIEQTLTIESADMPDFVLDGVKLSTLTLGAATETTNVTLIDCDIDTINTITGTILGKLTIIGKAPRVISLSNGAIADIEVKYTDFEIGGTTHFFKATNSMNLHHNTFLPASVNTTATNMIQIDSDARFSHNYVADVNRDFHVTVASGAILDATNNTHYKAANNLVYGNVSGTINKISNAINNLLDP